jgi:hypothetical protein
VPVTLNMEAEAAAELRLLDHQAVRVEVPCMVLAAAEVAEAAIQALLEHSKLVALVEPVLVILSGEEQLVVRP